MARRFAKISEEEIEEAFFYPSNLVNTKTTIPLRVGAREEQWILSEIFPCFLRYGTPHVDSEMCLWRFGLLSLCSRVAFKNCTLFSHRALSLQRISN